MDISLQEFDTQFFIHLDMWTVMLSIIFVFQCESLCSHPRVSVGLPVCLLDITFV